MSVRAKTTGHQHGRTPTCEPATLRVKVWVNIRRLHIRRLHIRRGESSPCGPPVGSGSHLAVFRRYQAKDATYFDVFTGRIDTDRKVFHGPGHLEKTSASVANGMSETMVSGTHAKPGIAEENSAPIADDQEDSRVGRVWLHGPVDFEQFGLGLGPGLVVQQNFIAK
jgi:hypothetical protein